MNCHWKVRPLVVVVLLTVTSLSFSIQRAAAQAINVNATSGALEKISIASVTETIKFLASDELAGRDTPSPGLDRASDYVAERFKKAGLEPLGKDGSFFQVVEKPTAKAPATAVLKSDGQPVRVLGVLSANEQPFAFSGPVREVGMRGKRGESFAGPVVFSVPVIAGRSGMATLGKRVSQLVDAGATACLLKVAADNPLILKAARARQVHLRDEFSGLVGPVILVAEQGFGAVEVALAAQVNDVAKLKNVIGVLRGSDEQLAKEAIVFTAHLDHIGTVDRPGDKINNGADDDASGVTGVLSLADAYGAAERSKRSVVFMTFWGEEKGLLGSRYYAANPIWPLSQTVANLNLEMLGRPEPGASGKVWMTGWHQSDLGKLMIAGAAKAGVQVFEHPRLSAVLYRQSDNYSFVEKGVVAHSFSAGSLHDDYHQPTDEWQKLRLDHMTKVIQGLFAGSWPIADGQAKPKKSPGRRPVR